MNSTVLMEHVIADQEDWTPGGVSARREKIKAWALTRWHVDQPIGTVPVTTERSIRLQAIENLAVGHGAGEAYKALVEAAESRGLYLVPHPFCVGLAPPNNHSQALFAVWPMPGCLKIGQWFDSIECYTQVPQAEAKIILGGSTSRYVTNESVGAFIDDLNRLLP